MSKQNIIGQQQKTEDVSLPLGSRDKSKAWTVICKTENRMQNAFKQIWKSWWIHLKKI